MDRLSYGPYLYALEPDVLAVLTMHGELHKSWLWLHAIGLEPVVRHLVSIQHHQQMLLSKPSVLLDGFSVLLLLAMPLCHVHCLMSCQAAKWFVIFSLWLPPFWFGCLVRLCFDAGVMGAALTDDQSGTAKLTRVAVAVGKVLFADSAVGCQQ